MTRPVTGAATEWRSGIDTTLPQWLQLVKSGDTVSGYASTDDATTWTSLGSITGPPGWLDNALAGFVATSPDNPAPSTAVFDNVTVSFTGVAVPPLPPPLPPPPPPPPDPSGAYPEVVVYASDLAASAIHGSWRIDSDADSPYGFKLTTTDVGFIASSAPLAEPADYVDVRFDADAATSYTIWLRLKALANSKFNDAVWVQFSDALANGAPVYPIGTSSGLLVNLATDGSAASLNDWGWQNGAYWLTQPVVISFAATGPHMLRVQVREDWVELDQIVLSSFRYATVAPGGTGGDMTIVSR
jgi:hypothetical protein